MGSLPEAGTSVVVMPQLLIGTFHASVPAAPVPSDWGFQGIDLFSKFYKIQISMICTSLYAYIYIVFLDLTVPQGLAVSATTSVAVQGAVQLGTAMLVTV